MCDDNNETYEVSIVTGQWGTRKIHTTVADFGHTEPPFPRKGTRIAVSLFGVDGVAAERQPLHVASQKHEFDSPGHTDVFKVRGVNAGDLWQIVLHKSKPGHTWFVSHVVVVRKSDDRLWKRVCDQMGFPRIGSKRRGKVINTCRPPFQRKLHQQPNPTFVADLVRLLLSANLFWMLRSW